MQREASGTQRPRAHYLAAAALGAALAVPAAAYAQDGFVGFGVGQSTLRDEGNALTGTGIDDSDTAWKLFGGYEFNENAAIEFAYIDFGEATSSAGNWEATGINVSALGMLPVGNSVSLLGKIGATRWDVDSNDSGVSASDNGTDLSYGLGVQYDFSRDIGGRFEWERFTDVGDTGTTGQSDLDFVSLSIAYRF